MVIRLLNGPLDNTLHEVRGGWPVPDCFALPFEGQLHWYETCENRTQAKYLRSEDQHKDVSPITPPA